MIKRCYLPKERVDIGVIYRRRNASNGLYSNSTRPEVEGLEAFCGVSGKKREKIGKKYYRQVQK